MNVLLIDPKKTVRDLLIKNLLPQGINVFHLESTEKANEVISAQHINLLIIDPDQDVKTALKILGTLGLLPNKPTRIVISSIVKKEKIVPFVKTGIAGYFIKPFTEENSLPKLLNIIVNASPKDEQRSFYRVSPAPNEEKKIFFRLNSNSKLISATIINLSAGGIALNCTENVPEEELKPGTFVPKIQLKLTNQDIILSGDVIYRQGTAFAIKFRNCAEEELFTLSKYIFNKISETI